MTSEALRPAGRHQYEMGLIGNCSYAALVEKNSNINWLCWPRFDSSFIFGSLIAGSSSDGGLGGEFSVIPQYSKFSSTQSYLENTNILVTKFETSEGNYEVTDFAPRFGDFDQIYRPLMLFRKISRLSGEPKIKVTCRPRLDYGERESKIVPGSQQLMFLGFDQPVQLKTNVPLTYILEGREFHLSETYYLVLTWGAPFEGPLASGFENCLSKTRDYWQGWVTTCSIPSFYQKEVIRSALALKLHQFEDTGGIVASVTTSLPEFPQSGRNWDYRYCWLRDSYYVLSALNSLGHFEEVEKYSHFVLNLGMDSPENFQPVFRVDGTSNLTERELNLPGYQGNKPVRIGNQAAEQIQNDSYGQILLNLFYLYTDPRLIGQERLSLTLFTKLLKALNSHVETPDNGPWEFRGTIAQHCYTSVFNWAGSAGACRIAKMIADPKLEDLARQCQTRALKIVEACFDPIRGVYTQAVGRNHLDASLLQMIPLGFFVAKSPELARSHLSVIEKELSLDRPGFLVRYKHKDDFGLQEAAFLMCGFWLAESLFCLGDVEKGVIIFENLLKTQNSLGLLSEDASPNDFSQWGNFPQTYSHVGVINCAFALHRAITTPRFLI